METVGIRWNECTNDIACIVASIIQVPPSRLVLAISSIAAFVAPTAGAGAGAGAGGLLKVKLLTLHKAKKRGTLTLLCSRQNFVSNLQTSASESTAISHVTVMIGLPFSSCGTLI